MPDSSSSRRDFLLGSTAGLAALPLVSAPVNAAMPTNACGGLTREQYMDYLTLFNNNDPRFITYYHDDVEFELANAKIRGAKAILDFYAEVKAHIKETVEVTHFISDATGVAAELPSEFRVIKDWEKGYFGRPLKVGQVLRIVSLGMYRVENGKFRRIQSARMRTINDWQMEG